MSGVLGLCLQRLLPPSALTDDLKHVRAEIIAACDERHGDGVCHRLAEALACLELERCASQTRLVNMIMSLDAFVKDCAASRLLLH